MTYQDMIGKAKAFREFREISQNKPQIVRRKEQLIQMKEQRIHELERMQKEVSFNLLNPKRYFAKYSPVVIAEEIKQLQQEIQIEQQAIDQLEDVFAVEVVDVKIIENELDELMKEQQKKVDVLTAKTLKVQKEYFDLLHQCALLVDDSARFVSSVSNAVNEEYRRVATRDSYRMDAFASTPLPMHHPTTITLSEHVCMDKRIRENHIERIFNPMGGLSHSILNRQ